MKSTYDIDAHDLLDFAIRWANLGDAITEQVERMHENPCDDDLNPNAIRMAHQHLAGFNESLDEAFEDYFEHGEAEAA